MQLQLQLILSGGVCMTLCGQWAKLQNARTKAKAVISKWTIRYYPHSRNCRGASAPGASAGRSAPKRRAPAGQGALKVPGPPPLPPWVARRLPSAPLCGLGPSQLPKLPHAGAAHPLPIPKLNTQEHGACSRTINSSYHGPPWRHVAPRGPLETPVWAANARIGSIGIRIITPPRGSTFLSQHFEMQVGP